MSKNLLIVESPAKAKTIEKFLGSDFTVKSCYGHIRDLPKGDKAIDIDNGYLPQYVVSDDKKKVVSELKQIAKKVDDIWLATDEDREGEAISWHLCKVLGLDQAATKRIVFHEITKPAILKAVNKPRRIDQNLVNAQQARRVLDRLVGFELSPVLWRKIKGSLSAGRVQSVAVRIIVERERDIKGFEAKPFFKLAAFFLLENEAGKLVTMKAELAKKFDQQTEAQAFLERCISAKYTIADIQVKPGKKSPSAPFTTSSLQQDASRKFGFSVSRTMKVAQKLYEAGKITYMRTDSTYLSETALADAKTAIINNFGAEYSKTRQYRTKDSNAQEAHEAIRPTYMHEMEAGSNADEKKLYQLIWKRTVASQMADARLERTTARINISTTPEQLIAKGEVLKFPGFLKLYQVAALDESSEEKASTMLPPLKVGQALDLDTMKATERFNRPPARYNEASLVKKLEELGIGRPSTYAPTISTIQNRGYAVKESREGTPRPYKVITLMGERHGVPQKIKQDQQSEMTGVEKNKLFPTDVGKVVNDFLVEHFSSVLDYSFTANIEKEFDEIASGKKEWKSMIDNFYRPFHEIVEDTLENAERVSGQRELGTHPQKNRPVYARLGRYGPMVQIGNSDDEVKPEFAKIRPPFTIESITLEQALEMFKLPRVVGNFEEKEMKVSEGRFGPYVLHNSKFYSLPKGSDPMTFTAEEAVELIKFKREEELKKIIKDYEEEHGFKILQGRWGPYIKAGKKNVKIPKGKTYEDLSIEDCLKLIEETPDKKTGGKKKAPAKKKTTTAKKKAPAKKKTTTRKTTAKKTTTSKKK